MVQLYLDCDGVLADFDSRALQILGMNGRAYEDMHGENSHWDALYASDDFFFNLEPLEDGLQLFEHVKHLDPIILTGCPFTSKEDDSPAQWAIDQKTRWAAKHFPGTTLISVRSKDKRLHCNPGDILVDDWPKYKPLWEEAGGKFVLYTSFIDAIDQLMMLGALEPPFGNWSAWPKD